MNVTKRKYEEEAVFLVAVHPKKVMEIGEKNLIIKKMKKKYQSITIEVCKKMKRVSSKTIMKKEKNLSIRMARTQLVN